MLKTSDYQTVAAFNYGTFIEYVLGIVLSTATKRDTIVLNNGGIYVFKYKNLKS